MVKNFIFVKIIVLTFINHIFSKIVLPLHLLPRENYKLIYPQNSPSDIIDTENRKTFYTIFQIGYPPQKVPLIIKPTSEKYIITNITPDNNISTYYRKYNFSKNFLSEYDYYSEAKSISSKLNWCRECEYNPMAECCSLNDDVIFYEDLELKNKTVNINFESRSDIEDNITGEIGLNLYDIVGRSYNTFLGILNKSSLIYNFNWYFDFNLSKNQEEKLIIGSLPHEDHPSSYSKENLFFTKSLIVTGRELTQMKFTKIYSIDNYQEQNITNEFYTNVELSYDSNIISCDSKYKNYLYQKLNDLLEANICFNETIKEFDSYRDYSFFYCKKESNVKNKLKEIIKPIYFYSDDFNYTFEINPDEIILENGDYIYIQIIFDAVSSRWTLGKIFTSKYKFVFNQKNKQIGFYNKKGSSNTGDKDNNSFRSKILWIISGIIVLCAILILLGYFIGKYLNKARKKRANELLDDFDYIQDNKDENNKNINNVIVDDDKNIN